VVERHLQPALAIVALLFACSATLTSSADSVHARQANAVAIERTGLSEHDDEYSVALCKRFRPTTAQVRKFLEHARDVETHVHTHDRYSPCYATGTVEFAGGLKGRWQIHSGQTGVLRTDDKRAATLLCLTCRWVDPFAGGDSAK
jgi:hypothetical protein